MTTGLQFLKRYYIVFPILYLFVSVFLLRSHVQYVYVISLALTLITALVIKSSNLKPLIILAYWILSLSAIGISASVILAVEKVEILTNPSYNPSCSLNPVLACSPVIQSAQSSAFGISNLYIGIFGFSAVFSGAMAIIAGAKKLHRLWWHTLLAGIAFNAFFCAWLFYQGVFVIGKLCLYCMLVWLVTFALLWLVNAYMIEAKIISFGKKVNVIFTHKYELIAFTYGLIFILIFYKWSDYWLSLF